MHWEERKKTLCIPKKWRTEAWLGSQPLVKHCFLLTPEFRPLGILGPTEVRKIMPINYHPVHTGIKKFYLLPKSLSFLAHSPISQYWPFLVCTLRSPESLLNHLQGQMNDIKCKVSLQQNWLFPQLISVEMYWVCTALMKNRSCLTNVAGYFYTFPLLLDK